MVHSRLQTSTCTASAVINCTIVKLFSFISLNSRQNLLLSIAFPSGCCWKLWQNSAEGFLVCLQGAKKTIFTACLSGKLKLEFTSPDVISNSPKPFWRAELISQFFCYSNSSKNITCSSGKLKTEFTCPIAKSTSPGLSDTTFFARWSYKAFFIFHTVETSRHFVFKAHAFTWKIRFPCKVEASDESCFILPDTENIFDVFKFPQHR